MIIIRLMGGLGNQMFQYAFGRHLAEIHKCTLKLDLSFLLNKFQGANVTIRKYELYKLNIIENIANQNDINKFTRTTGLINIISQKINPYKIIRETQFHFDENILKSGKNSYSIDGYWQSEKYFKNIENIIRNDFQIKADFKEKNKNLEEKIKSTESVSIHIRRGDYVTNEVTNNFHGICSVDYYQNAIKQISQLVSYPVFYIFSDDIEWAKTNIVSDFSTYYVDNDVDSNDEDLKLMSMCKHHIIANSSFSWWGAWLNPDLNKIVIAPSKWFNDTSLDTKDLYPDNWIKI